MAEGILSDAAGRILELLGSVAAQEIQLAYGVKYEILKLKDTVQTINGVLRDAEEQFNRKKSDDAVTGLLRRLKDAVYDADDLLDDFCTQLKLKELMSGHKMAKEVRIFFSKSNQIAYSLKMGHKIKTIRERLDAVKSDEQFLRFKPDNGKGMNYYNRLERETHSYVPKENVVGREKDIETIIKLLLDSGVHAENNLSVISIVGIGGVGKTALAQSVYNAKEVVNHFQLRMWVCVSDDFTLKIIVEKILKAIDTEKNTEKWEMEGLQKELRRQIDVQKYLLVLDDAWNDNLDKWLSLETLLRNGAKGSKIIVTTRSKRVAQIMSKPQLIHDLEGLIEDMSWSLFKKIVFEQGKEPQDSSDLVAIGKDIVRKCVGVPLAIRTIARLLYGKDEKYWLSFRDQELFEIDQSEGDIMPILKLSYDHLSPQLKQCFAYCALFPKDYEFKREDVIQLWMAQGFLGAPKKNQSSEDVGNEYFRDLLSGSFLQDLKEEWDLLEERKLVTCKMHDLMHDLAQLVVGSECKMITNDGDNVDERSHHISLDPSLYSLEISTAMLRANRFRTFLPLRPGVYLSDIHFSKFISSFKCLRTLKLNNIRIKEVPTSIGKLKHLRYLDLSENDDIKELPDSMSKLINLQTLVLCGCRNLQQLPRNMRKMVSLRYLTLNGCNFLSMPRGLGQLTGLRRLSLFVAGKRDRKNDALRELNGLNELRGSLKIEVLGDKQNVNLAEVNLEEKQYLESLWLSGDIQYGRTMVEGLKPHPNLKELSIYYLGSVVFSGCMSSFTHLSKIKIYGSSNLRSITPLDQLPSLLHLILDSLSNLEYVSESDRVGDSSTSTPLPTTFFPSLKKLFILNCNKLKEWWKINDDQATTTTEEEKAEVLLSFTRLSELFIWDCPELTCMPLYPTMEELSLEKTSAKTLQQTMEMKMKSNADVDDAAGPSTSYSAFSAPALSNLKSLVLRCIDDLESLPELLQRVNSLVEMDISHSPKLISQLPQCIKYLSYLEKLTIGGGDQLDLQFDDDDDDCQWQGLRSLRYLNFEMVKNMECLPKWINHITALQRLHIFGCESLMYLPEGMQMDCLVMQFCPHLTERCGNNEGEEWPKIAHIPNILIEGRRIQLEGHYQGWKE
ncbi:NBS-LRR disease resistance protein [Melia azedarach]|uniref:NBS-LRR disease resistance protein n=1 Tax=Melia azedarach TaxID=155640 RepID=A0ACC1XZA6_MELAZ|nr:NBS-LRR disease resistance protein [Melia azedarach]